MSVHGTAWEISLWACVCCLSCMFAFYPGLFFKLSTDRAGKVVFDFIVLFFPSYSCINELEKVVLIAVYVCFANVYVLCEVHGKAAILFSHPLGCVSWTQSLKTLCCESSQLYLLYLYFSYFRNLSSGPTFTSSHILQNWLSKTDDPSMA